MLALTMQNTAQARATTVKYMKIPLGAPNGAQTPRHHPTSAS